jgi:SNF2 family DNA or RNA helicase
VARASPFGPLDSFVSRFGDAATSPAKQSELAQRIQPFVLRRTKEECLDLPDKTIIDVLIELPVWQRELYDSVRDGLIREVQSMSIEEYRLFSSSALVRLLRLSQIASNPALSLKGELRTPGKFIELDNLLDELVRRSGRKVIVWSYYVETIKTLAARYASLGTVTLFGETPPAERQAIARRFQEEPDTRVLIANPAAAGTGFTLTAACYTVYETLSWRYDLYAQSQDRNHRIGQNLPVTCMRLIAAGTVEELITQALERKGMLAGSVLGDSTPEIKIGSLTPQEFCRMLMENRLPEATKPTMPARP